jgi:hypothetical protein
MKKIPLLSSVLFIAVTSLLSCDKATTVDDFEEANGSIVEKQVKRIETNYSDAWVENYNIIINYDGNNKVSSVSDGEFTKFFNYDSSGDLMSVSDNGNDYTLTISDLYQAPYDVFDKGEVLEYDDKGNPTKISVFEDGYNSSTLIGDIFYDPNPNPFFYTLKAANIIDILDNVEFNFGYQSPTIIKAKQLLPFNNISGMIFKDSNNETKIEIQFDYTYDNDGYPIRADVYTFIQGESDSHIVNFYYR